jgi:hypothetical protein
MKLTKFEMTQYRQYSKVKGSALNTCKLDQLNVHLNGEYEHELAKFKLFWDLRKAGHRIITEAWGRDGLRRDLVDLTDGEIYEIDSNKTKRGRRHPSNINVWWYNESRWRKREEVEDVSDEDSRE